MPPGQEWCQKLPYARMVSVLGRSICLLQHAGFDSQGESGNLSFPPVYPAMGYLGSLLWPYDPFLPVHFLLSIAFIWLSWRNFCATLPESVSLVATALLIHISSALFVDPWTSSVSAAGIALLLYLNLYGKYARLWGLVSGVVVALIFGSRTQDVVPAALLPRKSFRHRRASSRLLKF